MPKPSKTSAGLLLFRRKGHEVEVLLAHPGGPFFLHRDEGVWTIPKGEAAKGEDLLSRAKIEFEEEVGIAPAGKWMDIGSISKRAARLYTAGHSRVICPQTSPIGATPSRLCGRLDQENGSNSQRLIAWLFSRWR